MINWKQIDTVLLDMDGTLLDLNFDNHFWKQFVPERYAEKNRITIEQAKRQLEPQLKAMEGRLEWYCLDYWSEQLALNMLELKQEIAELISILPHVVDFLSELQQTKRQVLLVTNAHRDTLGLKLEKTRLHAFFDDIVCSHDFGMAKEQPGFWQTLQNQHVFDKNSTLFIDDSIPVLKSAQQFGVKHLVAISKPDSALSKRNIIDFPAIEDFRELMPIE